MTRVQLTGRRRGPDPSPTRERGATLVEYALGVALICLVCLGGIQLVQRGASDELDERAARSGAPDLGEGVHDGGGAGEGGGSGSPTSSVPAETVTFGGFHDVTATKAQGPEWRARLEVLAVGPDGPIEGVRVVGEWTYVHGSTPTTIPAVCEQTTTQGRCSFQLSTIPNGASSVTFTMITMSGGVPPVEYRGTPQVTEVLKP